MVTQLHKKEIMKKTVTPVYKITLIGDGAVGKTALRNQFMGKVFTGEYLKTLGADVALKTKTVDDKEIKFQIWDLAGQPFYETVRKQYYRGALGALVVFDVTRLSTLANVPSWIERQWNDGMRGKVPIIILGNKTDLRDEVDYSVAADEGQKVAKMLNEDNSDIDFEIQYFETSAKTGRNVEEAFLHITRNIRGFIDSMMRKRKEEKNADK